MLISKIQQNFKERQREYEFSSPNSFPQSTYPMNSIKNIYKERPLKTNSSNLSFKGSFLYRVANEVPYSISRTKDMVAPHIGGSFNQLFEHVKASKYSKKFVQIKGDSITFNKKSFLKNFIDNAVWVVKDLPGDILNGTVALLKKFKPTQKWAEEKYNSKFLKDIRQKSKIDAQVNSLRGLFETADKLKGKSDAEVSTEMFRKWIKMFDPKTGNYDTKHERTLNRLVSGLPPAVFLANDAYNLSRMMDDDDKLAKKEKKIRFKQEVSRIGFSAYLTLVTMGALQKYINKSKLGVVLMTGSTVLVTEMISRLMNGKHIARLTPEGARKDNIKNHAKEAEIKAITFTNNEKKDKKAGKKSMTAQSGQKPLLSFDTLMKASAVIIAAGFGIKFARKAKPIDDGFKAVFKPFEKLYNKLTIIDNYKMPKQKFDDIIKVLEDNGFNEIASKYKEVASKNLSGSGNDAVINLGKRDKKVKPLVNFVIAPFKFAYNTVKLPFTIANKAVHMFDKTKPKEPMKEVEALAKSIDKIGRKALNKNYTPEQFKSFVNDNVLKAFNVDTLSSISNSELSNLAKTAATAATIWFLMTDNYNMVMLKSNGNDKQGAETKFKERFVQEGSRLFYQTLLIDLFNSTFRNQYNGSLLGMSWITLTNTTIGEWLTRKSVGTPVKPHTREEMIALEEKQDNAKGFLKKYYNFMTRLTGKRSIKTYDVKKAEIKAEAMGADKIQAEKTVINTIEPSVNFEKNIFQQFNKI